MTDELWEDGLRGALSGTAQEARIGVAPTDTIVRRGRTSVRRRNGATGTGAAGLVAVVVVAATSFGSDGKGGAAGAATPGGTAKPSAAPTTQPSPVGDAVITLGSSSARTKVLIYEDFRCVLCKQLDEVIEPIMKAEAETGRVQFAIRPVDLIDENMPGTNGSSVVGNSVLCAARSGKAYDYREALYEHQPGQGGDAYASSAYVIDVARTVPGLDTPAFEDCVKSLPYASGIKKNFEDLAKKDHPGVPMVFIDGQRWSLTALDQAEYAKSFKDALAAAEAKP